MYDGGHSVSEIWEIRLSYLLTSWRGRGLATPMRIKGGEGGQRTLIGLVHLHVRTTLMCLKGLGGKNIQEQMKNNLRFTKKIFPSQIPKRNESFGNKIWKARKGVADHPFAFGGRASRVPPPFFQSSYRTRVGGLAQIHFLDIFSTQYLTKPCGVGPHMKNCGRGCGGLVWSAFGIASIKKKIVGLMRCVNPFRSWCGGGHIQGSDKVNGALVYLVQPVDFHREWVFF